MAKTPKPPTPVDPKTIIQAQQQANQINRVTPFGSQMYSKGPDGNSTFTTELSPAMKGLVDKATNVAGTDLKPLSHPQGFDDLQSAMLAKVQGGQPQYAPKKSSQTALPQINQMNGQNVNPAWNQVLGNIYGKPQ
jgi:hypothetical protein